MLLIFIAVAFLIGAVIVSFCENKALNKNKEPKMKATLEFNLPEDAEDFNITNRASYYYSLLFNIKNSIRSYLKYQESSKEKAEQLLEQIYKDISNEIEL